MNGTIINTNKIKSIKSDCHKCFHYSREICHIYGYKPNKKMCKRYSRPISGIGGTGKTKKVKISKAERNENYKQGLIDKTIY